MVALAGAWAFQTRLKRFLGLAAVPPHWLTLSVTWLLGSAFHQLLHPPGHLPCVLQEIHKPGAGNGGGTGGSKMAREVPAKHGRHREAARASQVKHETRIARCEDVHIDKMFTRHAPLVPSERCCTERKHCWSKHCVSLLCQPKKLDPPQKDDPCQMLQATCWPGRCRHPAIAGRIPGRTWATACLPEFQKV